ncbi:alpha/beta fold hydrolase [Catenuloplanes japonicus]|uniref:alpha/beta fold hydrolase n=1 Tax=Catenuloplanes japonicus TaxID=33876 RepID=UPI00068CA1D5|nr:alpha/beta fold hydrolase [Catenuloplanes japonicus]
MHGYRAHPGAHWFPWLHEELAAGGIDVTPRIAQTHAIYSDNDPIVPPQASAALAARLHSTVHVIPHGGHFLTTDGFTTFPAILPILKPAP